MSKDLGVWTAQDWPLVLIDYQNEMFEIIGSHTPANLVEVDGVEPIERALTNAFENDGLQAVNTMDFIARSPRGWSVPLMLPVAQSWQSFDPDGHLKDGAVASQLRKLGAEVVRAARQFQADGTCDYAEGTGIGPEVGVALDGVEGG